MQANIIFGTVPESLLAALIKEVCDILARKNFAYDKKNNRQADKLADRWVGVLNRGDNKGLKGLCLCINSDDGEISWNRTPFYSQSFDALDDFRRLEKEIPAVKIYNRLKLTDEYDAEIKEGYVQVGCQQIPFDKIRQLYKLLPPE
jgi:hypothetical protein